MDQEGHVPENKGTKLKEVEITQDSIVQNKDVNTLDKSVCFSAVDLTDAWLLVFNYIEPLDRIRIARVCRRWRDLVRISWNNITRLSFDSLRIEPGHLDSCYGSKLTDDFLEVLLQKCGTRLRSLYFTGCYGHGLTSHALDLVGHYCTSLHELILPHMNVKPTALETLLKKLLKLRSLNLQKCNRASIDEEGLISALKMLQSLKSLNVANIYHLTGSLFSQAPSSLTVVIAPYCALEDNSVHLLAERCPNLETIDFSYCRNLSGQSITFLANNCRKLKRFQMNSSIWCRRPRLTEHFLTLTNLPLLEVLFVDWHGTAVTDEVFSELGRHCPLLRSISCENCDQLTDAAISHLSPCLHLESIVLNHCHRITDKGLIQLSSAHSELKKVFLRKCSKITDEGVGRLLSDHPNLLELNISNCPLVTDGVLLS